MDLTRLDFAFQKRSDEDEEKKENSLDVFVELQQVETATTDKKNEVLGRLQNPDDLSFRPETKTLVA